MISGVKKGWIPPLPEIGNRRSMIHVDDLVEAILLVASNKTSNGEIFIATDGNSYSARKFMMLCVKFQENQFQIGVFHTYSST